MVMLISSKHLNPHVHTTRKATELPSLTDISILTHTSHTKQMPTSGSNSSTNRWEKKIQTRIHPGGHGISAMCPSRQRRAEPSVPEGLKYPWAPSPGEGPAACFASYKIANPMSYSVRSRPGPAWQAVSPAGGEQHRAYTCSGHSTCPPEKANGFLAICLSLKILCSKYKLWD